MKGWAVVAARLLVGGVFVVAGAVKLRDPSGFATAISRYQLFPELSSWLAVVLPTIELAAGLAVLLLGPAWRRAGAVCAAAMMAMFTVAAAAALVRGLDVACGCFGSASDSIGPMTIVRDVALLGAALLVAAGDRGGYFPRTARAPSIVKA